MPDSDETRTIRTKSDNINVTMVSETDEIIEERFKSLLQKYQEKLKESMRGSNFLIYSVDVLHYDLNRISLSRRGSYINSPKWLKNKKTTINPINKDGKCFQYAVTVALNYKDIENNPQEISKIKPFIDQYNWKEINFSSHKEDWKKFELNKKYFICSLQYSRNKICI